MKFYSFALLLSVLMFQQQSCGQQRLMQERAVVPDTAATLPVTMQLPPPRADRQDVFRVGNGVTAPRLIFKVDQTYSEAARQARVEGGVALDIVVESDGAVRDVLVHQLLGSLAANDFGLAEKAIEAIRQCRFQPGMRNGEPVAVHAIVEVTFRLE